MTLTRSKISIAKNFCETYIKQQKLPMDKSTFSSAVIDILNFSNSISVVSQDLSSFLHENSKTFVEDLFEKLGLKDSETTTEDPPAVSDAQPPPQNESPAADAAKKKKKAPKKGKTVKNKKRSKDCDSSDVKQKSDLVDDEEKKIKQNPDEKTKTVKKTESNKTVEIKKTIDTKENSKLKTKNEIKKNFENKEKTKEKTEENNKKTVKEVKEIKEVKEEVKEVKEEVKEEEEIKEVKEVKEEEEIKKEEKVDKGNVNNNSNNNNSSDNKNSKNNKDEKTENHRDYSYPYDTAFLSHRTRFIIYIAGLEPYMNTIHRIFTQFHKFGRILGIKVDRDGKYALVEYFDLKSAYAAVNVKRPIFDNKLLRVGFASKIDYEMIEMFKKKEDEEVHETVVVEEEIDLEELGEFSSDASDSDSYDMPENLPLININKTVTENTTTQ